MLVHSKLKRNVLAIFCIVTMLSCHSKTDQKVQLNTIKARDLNDSTVANINNSLIFNSYVGDLIKTHGAKGGLWKAFNAMYINCLKNAENPPLRRLIYLGSSNSKTIGTIYGSDGKSLINGFYKCFLVPGSNLIDSVRTNAEFQKFAEFNNPSTCDLTQTKNLALSYLLESSVPKAGDAKLSSDIKSSDSIVLKATSWSKIQIYDSLFTRYLDSCTNPSVVQYRNDILNNNNQTLVAVYKITGFTGEIYRHKGFDAQVQAKLKDKTLSIPVDVASTDTSSSGPLRFNLTLNTDNNTVINVTSNGDFYVYGIRKTFTK